MIQDKLVLFLGVIPIVTISFYLFLNISSDIPFETFAWSTGPVPDDNCVIMYKYDDLQYPVYNPLMLSAGGLNYYKEWQNTKVDKSKDCFINTANWLVKNAKNKDGGKYTVWEYNFPWPWYKSLKPPYGSVHLTINL